MIAQVQLYSTTDQHKLSLYSVFHINCGFSITLTELRYKEKFTAVCQEIYEFGLKEHEKREAEIASFFSCLEEATQDNNNAGVKHIHSYIEYKKKVSQLAFMYCSTAVLQLLHIIFLKVHQIHLVNLI